MQDRTANDRSDASSTPTPLERARPIVIIVGAIWVVFILDLILPLEQLGLVPRSLTGLLGIVAMPFVHGNFGHLSSNTLPLTVLLGLMVLSRPRPWSTLIILTLISGVAYSDDQPCISAQAG